MSLNDKLRLGTLSREDFEALEQRVSNLESAAQGDGAAVPSIYTINKAGEVNVTENVTIVEAPEVEEGEGDLLIVEGGKTKRLKPGPKGDFLSSDGKKLKWVAAPEGGGRTIYSPGVLVPIEWTAEAFFSGTVNLTWPAKTFTAGFPKMVMTQIRGFSTSGEAGEAFYVEVAAWIAGEGENSAPCRVWSNKKMPKGTKVNIFWSAY